MILNRQQGRLSSEEGEMRMVQVSTKGPDILVEYIDELPIDERTQITLAQTPITTENGKFIVGELGVLETNETGGTSQGFTGKSNNVQIKILEDASLQTGYVMVSDKTVKVQGNGIPLYSGIIKNIEEQNRTLHPNKKQKYDVEMTRDLIVETTNGYLVALECFSEWCGCSNNQLKEYLKKIEITKL